MSGAARSVKWGHFPGWQPILELGRWLPRVRESPGVTPLRHAGATRSGRPTESGLDLKTAALSFVASVFLFSSVAMGGDVKDVIYATVGGKPLGLDLHLPDGVRNPPLVVWVHGGGWSAGTKENYPKELVGKGFAVASLDFRQTTEAPFPANVHDIKAGIRFLRAKAADYGYRTDRIAIAGASSGGHLAALVGVTNGNKELEGSVGDYAKQSSSVQAIVSYFGASNLTTILAQSTPFGLNVRRPALERLLVALPENAKELAVQASPVSHVDRSDPPLLLLHGDQDPQMPINQSHELQGAYAKLALDVDFDVLHGAAHGGEAFFAGEPLERAVKFLQRTIGK
jgi:acetyl esterase/lipase